MNGDLMNDSTGEFLSALQAKADPEQAIILSRFFKTGKGQYGEGDTFWGIKVPVQKKIATKYYKLLSLDKISSLLQHPVHEVRNCALIVLVKRFQKSKEAAEKKEIVELYLDSMDYINNWDLVDTSAPYVLGEWFYERSHDYLIELAESGHLWMQRIAMLSTFYFIRQMHFNTAFVICEKLLFHQHDLIHKAVGWMLREIGNRDYQAEYEFLIRHYKKMPRTMLRYAIEKFDEPIRQAFLKGTL
jgi:3-methyladenine DNA glycosylase AlkD